MQAKLSGDSQGHAFFDSLRNLDLKLLRHFLRGRVENPEELIATLKTLSAECQVLMHSMANFAYIEAGYDLDNPLGGTLMERFQSSLVSRKLMESDTFLRLAGLKSISDPAYVDAESLGAILNSAKPNELALLDEAMSYAYFEARPDKSGLINLR